MLVAVIAMAGLYVIRTSGRVQRLLSLGASVESTCALLGGLAPRLTITREDGGEVQGRVASVHGYFPELGTAGDAASANLACVPIPIGMYGIVAADVRRNQPVASSAILRTVGEQSEVSVRLLPHVHAFTCDNSGASATARSPVGELPVHAYLSCVIVTPEDVPAQLAKDERLAADYVAFVTNLRSAIIEPALASAVSSYVPQHTHSGLVRLAADLRDAVEKAVSDSSEVVTWRNLHLVEIYVGAAVVEADLRSERTLAQNLRVVRAEVDRKLNDINIEIAANAQVGAKVAESIQRLRRNLRQVQDLRVTIKNEENGRQVFDVVHESLLGDLNYYVDSTARELAKTRANDEDVFRKLIESYWANCTQRVEQQTKYLTRELDYLIKEVGGARNRN